jgi:iron complex outermembrane receptor protein
MLKKSIAIMMATASAFTLIPAGARTVEVSPPATDPSDQTGSTGAGSGSLDIIVTARRVGESIQKVPASITALSGAQLAQKQITTVNDLQLAVPSLQAYNNLGRDAAILSIRGYGQEQGTSPSVATYFADVPVPRGGPFIQAGSGAGPGYFLDLENVQILKGPQGTLFGKNTTGGAVLLVPAKPNDTFTGYVEGLAGSYNWFGSQAVINVPINDRIRTRFAFDQQKRHGFTKNIGAGPDLDDRNYIAARASVVIDVTDNLENYTILSYTKSRTNGSSNPASDCNLGVPSGQLFCGGVAEQAELGPRRVDDPILRPVSNIEQWGVINTTTFSAGPLTFKNIASYTRLKTLYRASPLGQIVIPGIPVFGALSILTPNGLHTTNMSTLTEEFQIQGRFLDGDLTTVSGLYFQRDKPEGIQSNDTLYFASCQNDNVTTCAFPLGSGFVNNLRGGIKYNSKGVYTQATLNLGRFTGSLRDVRLTGGFRYTLDRTTGFDESFISAPVTTCTDPTLNYPACHQDYQQKSSSPTYTVGLDWQVDPMNLIYGKYSRGYRQGGIVLGSAGQVYFQPEKVDDVEIGLKSTFRVAGKSAHFNIAAFRDKLANQQLLALSLRCLNPACTAQDNGSTVINGGKSRLQGIEADANISPMGGLSLDLSYAYLDSKLQSITLPTTAPGVIVVPNQVAGDRIPNTPKNKVTAAVTYFFLDRQPIGRLSGTVSYAYSSRNVINKRDPAATLESYGVLNVVVDWKEILRSRLDAEIFVTNLTNKAYRIGIAGSYEAFGVTSSTYGEPRMIGGRIRYGF